MIWVNFDGSVVDEVAGTGVLVEISGIFKCEYGKWGKQHFVSSHGSAARPKVFFYFSSRHVFFQKSFNQESFSNQFVC